MATVQTFSSTMGDRSLGKLTVVHNGQSDEFNPAVGNSTVTITGTAFEAVIGTTTYAEVDAAFHAGQFVFTKHSMLGYILNLVHVQADEFKFVGVDRMGHAIEATLDSGNNWSIDTNALNFSLFETAIAPRFVSGPMYDVGRIVTHNGKLYRFKTSHQGAWDDDDVDEINMSKFPLVDYVSDETTRAQIYDILEHGRIPVFKMSLDQGEQYLQLSCNDGTSMYFYSIKADGGYSATLYWARISVSEEWTSGSNTIMLL